MSSDFFKKVKKFSTRKTTNKKPCNVLPAAKQKPPASYRNSDREFW